MAGLRRRCRAATEPCTVPLRCPRLTTYDGGQYDAAVRSCHLALALDPYLAEAHNLRDMALEELDRPGAAVEAYQQALDLDRDWKIDPSCHSSLEHLDRLVHPGNHVHTKGTALGARAALGAGRGLDRQRGVSCPQARR